MFVTASQIQNGIIQFISTDMIPKTEGWKRVVFGAALSLAAQKDFSPVIMQSELLRAIGIVTQDDLIDLDSVKQALCQQLKNDKIQIDIPAIGSFKIGQSDIQRIANIISKEDV